MMDEPCGLVEVTMSCPLLMKLLTTHSLTISFTQLRHDLTLQAKTAAYTVTTSSFARSTSAKVQPFVVEVDNRAWRISNTFYSLQFFFPPTVAWRD